MTRSRSILKPFRVFLLFCCVSCFGTVAAHADPFGFSFVLLSPAISGPAGSTIGWGYTITNLDPENSLDATQVGFEGSFPTKFVTPDASIFNFPHLGPNETLTIQYDVSDPTFPVGLYQITWDPSTPPGYTVAGSFVITTQFYDSLGNPLELEQSRSAVFSASVSDTAPPVPEPSSIVLLGSGLAGLAAWNLKRKRARFATKTVPK